MLSSDRIKSTWAFQKTSEVMNNYDITAQNAIAAGSDAKTSTVAPLLTWQRVKRPRDTEHKETEY